MALTASLTLTDNFGIDVSLSGLYIRVDRIDGNKESLIATVGLYQNNGAKLISNSTYKFKPSVATGSFDFIKQAYLHLKTLSEFADAVDC
jgi:hypothetical protein